MAMNSTLPGGAGRGLAIFLRPSLRTPLLLLPAILFLGVIFLFPLYEIVARSVPGGSLDFYTQILSSKLYARVIGATFWTSLSVMVLCLLIAYPYAYAMAHARGMRLMALTIALLLPFWVSLLLRTFSWMILLQDSGIINSALLRTGLIETPLKLIRNPIGVKVGMVHILLPYAVLPLYAVMKKIDPRLMEASAICGAGQLRSFLRVYLPLTLPGAMAAALLTFTLALGFYITPALLGGPRDSMIGQLIAVQIGEQLNFGFGSALAVVLLLLTIGAFLIAGLAMGLWKLLGRRS